MTRRTRRGARGVLMLAAAALVARGAFATEAKGDLSLELRVVETAIAKGRPGRKVSGTARIEVALDSFRTSHDVILTLSGPGGRPLLFRSKPVALGSLGWSDARGTRLMPGARGIVVPARGRILTRLEVPLEGVAVHEIVVRASALAGEQEVSTEGVVYVPVGIASRISEDAEAGIANFSLTEVD